MARKPTFTAPDPDDNDEDLFGAPAPDEALEDEDTSGEISMDDLDRLDEMGSMGLKPGGFKTNRNPGASWDPQKNLKRGGIGDHLKGRRDDEEEELSDEDIEAELRELEEDPAGVARKQLMRMFSAQKRRVNRVYRRLEREDLTPKQESDLIRALKDANESLLSITEALRLQPKQSKDDGERENIASLSQALEEFKRERSRGTNTDDPYGLKQMIEDQKKKIKDSELSD